MWRRRCESPIAITFLSMGRLLSRARAERSLRTNTCGGTILGRILSTTTSRKEERGETRETDFESLRWGRSRRTKTFQRTPREANRSPHRWRNDRALGFWGRDFHGADHGGHGAVQN